MKFCECGCGQPTAIATRNWYALDRRKGEPARFISGHNVSVPRTKDPAIAREEKRAYDHARWLRDKAKLQAYFRDFYAENRDAYIARSRRRHIEYGDRRVAGGWMLERDWRRLVNRYHGKCAYCGIRPATDMDHVIPVTRGGLHTIGNVLPACRPCNVRKSDQLLVEWRR